MDIHVDAFDNSNPNGRLKVCIYMKHGEFTAFAYVCIHVDNRNVIFEFYMNSEQRCLNIYLKKKFLS